MTCIGIRGVWQTQEEALFDVRVVDTDAPSHCHRAPNAILESSSQEKKKMYKKAIEDRRGTFTPFVLSVDWLLHKEASHFLKHMTTALSFKWDKAYSITSSMSDHGLVLQGFKQWACVLEGPTSNGEVGWSLMMVLLYLFLYDQQLWLHFINLSIIWLCVFHVLL